MFSQIRISFDITLYCEFTINLFLFFSFRFNSCDNNHTGGIYTLTKNKPSRAPQTGHFIAGNSSVSRSSETPEAWEQPSSVNNTHAVRGTTNPKRPLPVESSLSPMAQWVGQRPNKISRTRRANVVSPALNCDEMHMSFESCPPSDVGTSMTSNTTSGSLISKGAINNIQVGRVKHENVSPPSRLSESEESGAGQNGESTLKEKGLESSEVDAKAINYSHNISSSLLVMKKKKKPSNEEIGDGLRKHGRGRGSSVLKAGISSMKEKLEISTLTKPIRNMNPASEENGRYNPLSLSLVM